MKSRLTDDSSSSRFPRPHTVSEDSRRPPQPEARVPRGYLTKSRGETWGILGREWSLVLFVQDGISFTTSTNFGWNWLSDFEKDNKLKGLLINFSLAELFLNTKTLNAHCWFAFSNLVSKNYITSITCGVALTTIHMVTERRIAFTFAYAKLSIIWHGTGFRAIKLIISIGTSWKNNKSLYIHDTVFLRFPIFNIQLSCCIVIACIFRFNDVTKMGIVINIYTY